MKDVTLSIIMPVYNTKKYLQRSLNSIIKEVNDKTELIVVDDCSTDGSLDYLKKYQKKYLKKNINIIHNDKNIGAGLSRNKAIDLSKGKYIGFIDSDDYVNPNYFNNMLKLIEQEQSDIVVSDVALVDDNGIINNNNIFVGNIYNSRDNDDKTLPKEYIFGNWACASTCAKLFKKDIIKDLKFSVYQSDDIFFTIPALMKAKKISYCRYNPYFYYQRANSLTRTNEYKKYKESTDCLLQAINYLYSLDINCAKIYSANALFPFFCYSLDDINLKYIPEYLIMLKNNLQNKEKRTNLLTKNEYLKNNHLTDSKIYRRYLKCIENDNYEKFNEILNNKYRPEFSFKDKVLNKIHYLKPRDKSFNPLVSIVIPVYNGANYIEEAINSALNQTYKNIEIIIVDDGSKDNTEEIIKKYKDKVRYYKKENGGVATALNLAINKMKGEYFSWLSHDDLYFPDKIEKQVEYLRHCKNKKIVLFSNYILINENGRLIGNPVIIKHNMIKKKQEYCLLRGSVNGITILIPKEAFQKCGNFNVNLKCTQDYDLWAKFLKKYQFVHMRDILSQTRIHELQDTNKNPLAITEGDELWTNLINDIPDKRKKELEGSLYNFYYKMAIHLKDAPYAKTLNMCIKKCQEINPKKYSYKPIKGEKKKTLYEKIVYCIDNYGYIYTIKVIIKKILRIKE